MNISYIFMKICLEKDLTVLVLIIISQADYFKNIMQRPSEDVFTKILIIHFRLPWPLKTTIFYFAKLEKAGFTDKIDKI